MISRGRVQNGVIVLDGSVTLPEGTVVHVLTEADVSHGLADTLSPDKRAHLLSTVARIASLPVDGLGDAFSGKDHDRVLYGSRE
jgi:hypothetical protein